MYQLYIIYVRLWKKWGKWWKLHELLVTRGCLLVYWAQSDSRGDQALTLAMCPHVPHAFLRLSGQFGPPKFIFHWPEGPVGFLFLFFSISYAAIILLGIGKTRKATLIPTYFSLYIGLMYKSLQLHAWNHKFPPRKHLGGQWVFWGASGPPGQWLPQSNVKAWRPSLDQFWCMGMRSACWGRTNKIY